MAIFTIADLHLSMGTDKPMDCFYGWKDYVSRIEENWRAVVTENDTVVLPGDFSWGMSFSEALPDFQFVEALPGKKVMLKGNHDYWWSTRTKTEKFFDENGLLSFEILHNNSVLACETALCGTRGWIFEPEAAPDKKVAAREVMRLEASLADSERFAGAEKLVFLHYPPVYGNEFVPAIFDTMKKYGVQRCFYGHVHGAARSIAVEGDYMGINFKLVSADNLKFMPLKVVE